MKKVYLSFLLVFLFLISYAQEQRIKQVQKDLQEHTQADTLRVNRLDELLGLIVLPLSKADSMANDALSISRKLHYSGGEVESLIAVSKAAYRKNDRRQARALLEHAMMLAQQLDDKTHLSNVYSALASLENFTGESIQAREHALKSVLAAQATPNKALLASSQIALANLYSTSAGDYTRAMEWALKGQKNAEEANSVEIQAVAWSAIATIYTEIGDQANSLIYYKKALNVNKKLGNQALEFKLLNRIGEMYRLTGKYAEAIKAYNEGLAKTQLPYNIELTQSNMADVYVRLANLPMAFKYGFESLAGAQKINDTEGEEWIDGVLARAYLKANKPDSAIYYASNGYVKANHTRSTEFKRDNAQALANAYVMKKDFANAYKYHDLYISYRDSMNSAQVTNQTSLLQYNYSLAKKQAQITTLNQDKKVQRYFITGALIVLVLIIITAIVLFRNNQQKQKANILLSKQKQLIEEERDKTNKALSDLQVTQGQLIQSEKMASLGELTAGIAHEIQNPLNFINNFAEVNREMIDEMTEELKSGNIEDALAVAENIKSNEEKITHHGKRADSIVKGMLQHSRISSTLKEPTDINKLTDEYLRLAYHGLRAKDKNFDTELVTHFDEKLPKASVVSQDIGRVMLNMFNNAFYAVSQKAKTAESAYKPTVEVSSTRQNGSVIISVKDNGTGIPENIREKIMQPFFTTKPTGEGTGLGLSLSYDIVVKGHGGKINVESKEGEGSEFTLTLPV